MAPVSSPDFLAELHANSKIEDVSLQRLQIDYTYQRDLSETLVDEIANNWDVIASELILVSNRGTRNGSDVRGGLFIVNGQHRSKAAQKKGLDKIAARVIDLRKEDDPAAIEAGFRLKTNVRLGDQPLERFKAELRAGDPRAADIKKILGQFDTQINEQTNTETGVNAVVSIESIYDYDGGGLLRDTLTLVKETYGQVGGTNAKAPVLKALAWFIDKHANESDYTRLTSKLQGIGLTALGARAKTIQLTLGGTLWFNYYRAVVDLYNEQLRDTKRLQYKQRGARTLIKGGGTQTTA